VVPPVEAPQPRKSAEEGESSSHIKISRTPSPRRNRSISRERGSSPLTRTRSKDAPSRRASWRGLLGSSESNSTPPGSLAPAQVNLETIESPNIPLKERITQHLFYDGSKDDSNVQLLIIAIYMEVSKEKGEKGMPGAVFAVRHHTKEFGLLRRATPLIGENALADPSSSLNPNEQGGSKRKFQHLRRGSRQYDPENPPPDIGIPSPPQTNMGIDSWLKDPEMLPARFPRARIIGFGLNLAGGEFDFDAGSAYILKRIANDCTSQTIAFIGHGYGNFVVAKLLEDDRINNLSDSLKASQEDIKECTVAAISFANPIALTQRKEVRDWTAQELGFKAPGDIKFDPKTQCPLEWGKLRKAAKEEGFALLAVLERPLPEYWADVGASSGHGVRITRSKPVQIMDVKPTLKFERQQVIQTIAESAYFADFDDPDFLTLCNAITNAINTYDVIRAVERGDLVKVNSRIEKGSEFNIVNSKHQSVLHIAVINRSEEMVKMLARCRNAKSLVDRRDLEGDTALHLALRDLSEQPEGGYLQNEIHKIIEVLIRMGAETGQKNEIGDTPKSLVQTLKQIPSRTKELIKKPKIVEERRHQQLSLGKPPKRHGQYACQKTDAVVTTVFEERHSRTNSFSPDPVSIEALLYSGRTIKDTMENLQPTTKEQKNILYRWYHLPANNVRMPTL
jgi:ankyrin repeat protein